MVEARRVAYPGIMQAPSIAASSSEARSPSASSAPAAPSAVPAALVLALFLPFSLWVLAREGVMALPRVITEEPWAAQLLVDLGISCFIAGTWMVRDARQRKITVWPFVVATALVGSIGLLAYYVRRSFSAAPAR